MITIKRKNSRGSNSNKDRDKEIEPEKKNSKNNLNPIKGQKTKEMIKRKCLMLKKLYK